MINKLKNKNGSRGHLEKNFFAFIQMRRNGLIRTGEIAPSLGLSRSQEWELLRRLARTGSIVRLQRGLYLAPMFFPAGGKWNPSESVVLPALMKALKARYQISGPSAFNRYGFDEQVPNRIFVYNDRLSGPRQIGSTQYVFIRVSDDRLGEVENVRTPDGEDLCYSSRARALVDVLYDWSRFNGIPRGLFWIRQELQKGSVRAAELARIAVRFGNQSALRRLGWTLEQAGAPPAVLKTVKKALNKSSSLIPLVPLKQGKGPTVKSWGVINNE
jgi:predicted transcriptional regulator of viral defense system